MDDFWWKVVGAIAGFMTFANLENARRGRDFTPLSMVTAGTAGYALFRNEWLWDYGTGEQLVALALIVCAVSPVLGWLWWGRDGNVRRSLGRAVLFLLIFGVATLLWAVVVVNPLVAIVLGMVSAIVSFKWGKWRAKARIKRQQKRWDKDRLRQQKELAQEQQSKAELERKQQQMLDVLIDELRR